MLFDLHMHTDGSYDSFNKLEMVLKTARARGLSGVAITDHEEFKNSLRATDLAGEYDLLVIPGMEIGTDQGDVIGLFLQSKITSIKFDDVIGEIKEQDGLSVLPHPYKRTRVIPLELFDHIDMIEAYNARGESIKRNDCNKQAKEIARKYAKPFSVGSDAHFLFEIGRGCIDLGEVKDLITVRRKLLEGRGRIVIRKESSKYVEVGSQFIKAYKKRESRILLAAFRRLVRTTKWTLKSKYLRIAGR